MIIIIIIIIIIKTRSSGSNSLLPQKTHYLEAGLCRFSTNQVFLTLLENSQKKAWARVSLC